MKITTEAHGSFPTEKFLRESGPRIAFVNSDEFASYLRASQVSKNVLILAADDISEEAIPSWVQGLLKLPPALSYITKRHLWRHANSKGFPNAPMSLGDAMAVLNFYSDLEASGAEHLIISCEYGKSRSVTSASFIREHIQMSKSKYNLSYPNQWIKKMLELARDKQPSSVEVTERDLKKIERYKQARIEFFKELEAFGGVLHTKEVAELLGISDTAVVDQVNEDRLIGIVDGEHHEYLIPAFQFVGSKKLPHLEELLTALGEIGDVTACSWFLNPLFPDFGMPYEILKAGASEEQLKIMHRDAELFLTPTAS